MILSVALVSVTLEAVSVARVCASAGGGVGRQRQRYGERREDDGVWGANQSNPGMCERQLHIFYYNSYK